MLFLVLVVPRLTELPGSLFIVGILSSLLFSETSGCRIPLHGVLFFGVRFKLDIP